MSENKRRKRRYTSDATEDFFEVRDPQNKRKTEIIEGFFKAYSSILLTTAPEVDYVDLYAGRGYYDRCAVDPKLPGQIDATPLRILKAIIADSKFARRVKTWFNEGLHSNVEELRAAVSAVAGIHSLTHTPMITEGEVNDQLAEQFRQRKDVPTFFFLDPFGYVGITRQLLHAALNKSWGCDIAFFFNYKRINMNLGTDVFDIHLVALFGEGRLAELRAALRGVENVDRREDMVLRHLRSALEEIGARYFLSYRFRYADGKTSHHLVFVTRHRKGYATMKDRMASLSAQTPDGVAYFEFVPDTPIGQPGLFDVQVITPPRIFPYGISQLANDLYRRYRGRTISIRAVFDAHNVDTPYVRKNYTSASWNLVDRHMATLRRAGAVKEPKRGQCPDDTDIAFQ
jgi:three-Cys-motif partner protein